MSNFASGYVKYINHLEQINDAALLRPKAMIDEVEDAYREHLRNIARNIVSHYGTAKVCMLAGPSSSGKTTTAHLLRDYLAALGLKAEIVSLDDFYLGVEQMPVLPSGERDYETVNALDIELVRACIRSVIDRGACMLPAYDFTTSERAACDTEITHKNLAFPPGLSSGRSKSRRGSLKADRSPAANAPCR